MTKTLITMMLLLWCINGHALSASSANYIVGNPPQFNASLEQEIAEDNFSLLKFSYLSQVYPNQQAMPLPDPNQTIQQFTQQVTLSPISLNEGDGVDIDGDGEMTAELINTSFTVLDKDNNVLDPKTTFCENVDKAPMTLKLSAQLDLSTRYGVTNTTGYDVIKQYTLSFKPTICSLKPSLIYGDGKYAGVASVWNAKQGFIYDESKTNFPTTGMDGLNYDVKVLGVDVLQAQIDRIYSGTAHIDLMFTPVDSQTLNITLRGPTADNPQNFSPNIFTVLIGPVITYHFKITNWFIQNNEQSLTWANANNWCSKLGNNQRYQLPAITQLSNASQDVSGNTGIKNYTRAIGQGFLPEWGSLVSYGLMSSNYIWSSTLRPNNGGHYYDAHNVIGSISSPVPTFQEGNLCVSK